MNFDDFCNENEQGSATRGAEPNNSAEPSREREPEPRGGSELRRTDLAVELRELRNERVSDTTALGGVLAYTATRFGFEVTTVEVKNAEGAAAIGKPKGTYVTVELDGLLRREDGAFRRGAAAIAGELSQLLALRQHDSVLVVGLGNRAITADSVGAEVLRSTLVTGNAIPRGSEGGATMRRVFALEAGVLGTTGIESARLVEAVCNEVLPDCVVVVDALAARSVTRLCRTVQISNAGIVAGSGLRTTLGARNALNRKNLGVPVVAIGVPTVVDAASLAADIAERVGAGDERLSLLSDELDAGLVVTLSAIDSAVGDVARLVAYALNLALHRGLTVDDVTMMLG